MRDMFAEVDTGDTGWTQVTNTVLVEPERGLEATVDADGAPGTDALLRVTETIQADGLKTSILRRQHTVSSTEEIATHIEDTTPDADLHAIETVDHDIDGFTEFVCTVDPHPDISEETLESLIEFAYGVDGATDNLSEKADLDTVDEEELGAFELHLVGASNEEIERVGE